MKKSHWISLLAVLLSMALLLCACTDSSGEEAKGAEGDAPLPDKPEQEGAWVTSFDENAVCLTFAVLSDVHNSTTQKASKMKKMMEVLGKQYHLDAFVFAGDLTDKINGTANYTEADFRTGFQQLAYFSEGVLAGNKDDLPIVWTLGNHEYPAAVAPADTYFYTDIGSYDISAGDTVLDVAYGIFSKYDTEDTFMTATEGAPTGFRHTEIYGYHFFAIEYNYVTNAGVAWLEAELARVEAEDPTAPIFVTSHMPTSHSSHPKSLASMLKNHPRVIYISGHTHVPMQNYSSIAVRDGIAETVIGPGDHGSYGISGAGYPYNSYSMKQAAVFEVDTSGNVRVTALDLSFDVLEDGRIQKLITKKGNNREYTVAQNPLVIRQAVFALPSDGGDYALREDTIFSSTEQAGYAVPSFGENALAVSDVTSESFVLSIGKAAASNLVKYYEIYMVDADMQTVLLYDPLKKTEVSSLKIGSDYIMHGAYSAYPEIYRYTVQAASALGTGESFTVFVKAYDDFGKASEAASFTFTVSTE